MSIIKKWSTGAIGNTYSDHSDRGNPNTKGLDINGRPGIEAYIEEDEVIASSDNRPLKNLMNNDVLISNNAADVASEVDRGVFVNRYNDFDISILPEQIVANPENPDEDIRVTPLRIKSGSAIINGEVTRIGNQKVIYFVRTDDENSLLFIPYDNNQNQVQIEIIDEDYFGRYEPVYSTLSEELPENFDNYTIRIINVDVAGGGAIPTRYQDFDMYRDWEDIYPLPAETVEVDNEILTFNSDKNFGQFSEGYRTNSGSVIGTKISDVEIKKNILIKDSEIKIDNFTFNNKWEAPIETKALFFNNVQLIGLDNQFDRSIDIQDVYISEDERIYFITRDSNTKNIYYRSSNTSARLLSKLVAQQSDPEMLYGLKVVNNYMFIYGTHGLLKVLNLDDDFASTVLIDTTISTTEDVTAITTYDNKIWIGTSTSLFYSNDIIDDFDPDTTSFTQINLNDYVKDSSLSNVIDYVTVLEEVRVNSYIESSLIYDVNNLISNPSFEYGGSGNIPNDWNINNSMSGSLTIVSDGKFGNFKAVLAKTGSVQEIIMYQDLYIRNIKVDDPYTFSAYIKTVNSVDVNLYIEELDSSSNVLNSNKATINTTSDWANYSVSHNIIDANTKILRVKIGTESTEPIQVDGSQLTQTDTVQVYSENFDYLFIGFKKLDSNYTDPPFALIDSRDKYNVKYDHFKYGEIKRINAATYKGHNEIYFVDDNKIYTLTLLNETDSYDRYSISPLYNSQNEDLNFFNRIEKFETIASFKDKIYFGGVVRNKVLKVIVSKDNERHDIEFTDAGIGGQQSLLTLLGTPKVNNPSYSTDHTEAEFGIIEECVEGSSNSYGHFLAGASYYIKIDLDGIEEATLAITAPDKNSGVWTLDNIYSQLKSAYDAIPNNNLTWIDPTIHMSASGEPDWRIISSSDSLIDGLYSIAQTNVKNVLKGNIHKIFINENNQENFYVVRGSQIFKSKDDENILKDEDGTYKNYQPEIKDSNYSLIKTDDKINEEIVFNDDPFNRSWIDINVDPGYKIVPGSIRVKTNEESEVGYNENIDYFIDYENSRIIRNSGQNYLLNSDFNLYNPANDEPNDWNYYIEGDQVESKFVRYIESDYFTEYGVKIYVKELSGQQLAILNQIYIPQNGLSVGDTYTFSVFLKSDISMSGSIRLVELNSNGSDDNNFSLVTTSQQSYDIDGTNIEFNKWHKFQVSRTITESTSGKLRVEILTNNSYNLYVTKAQLERNPSATKWINSSSNSRIDPDSHVWIDYREYKELTPSVDYTFDILNRKIILEGNQPVDPQHYYIQYKYEKIFNPFDFGNIIPKTQVTYNEKDDYFLYTNEGRIWAINQMLAILSLETEDPLLISYKYHYPRVDAIKIRNNTDAFGNLVYIVKGVSSSTNPYKPNDKGAGFGIDGKTQKYYYNVSPDEIEDDIDNDTLYEINIVSNNYNENDIYDRRVYIDARYNLNYNISLYPETVAYFPFQKDFNSTNGLAPLNIVKESKIIPIIKYYSIIESTEVGAWHNGYQLNLRTRLDGYTPFTSIYVDPISGLDSNDGTSIATAVKTVSKAVDLLYYNDANDRRNNIVVTSPVIISENISIDKNFAVNIYAATYCYWHGAIQNISPLNIQGIWFQNSDLYAFNDLNLYYCTLEASNVNLSSPQNVNFYNIEAVRCYNSILRVNESLHPSPFEHPFFRQPARDDGIPGNPPTVATSQNESIAPGDNLILNSNTSGSHEFVNCLIHESTDHIVDFDPEADWTSNFVFDNCTIAYNKNLFSSSKYGLNILYMNSILYQNREVRNTESKVFNTNSDIQFDTCFIDFPATGPDSDPSKINYLNGQLIGRDTCIGLSATADPNFLSRNDFHLQSIARGSSSDSICLNANKSGLDLGCYNESREQTEKDLPKKLRNYIAFINEGIIYPIRLNSEKITVTIQFKPTASANQDAVIFDTRASFDDEDYIILAYNNNEDYVYDLNSINPDPSAPYRFRVILKNKNATYSVISPIKILNNEDFTKWHRISFTINYEKIYNLKTGFAEHDKQQNIITLYHNEATSVESFIKYDLSRDQQGYLLTGRGNEGTNAWDFNDICQFITLGASYDNSLKMSGYYSELRIDNRFIDRKQFELWNVKKVPFNDPLSYVNQTPLTKSIDSNSLIDYWSLRDKYGVGAKNHYFKDDSSHRAFYDKGIYTWFLGRPTNNLIRSSSFHDVHNAHVSAASEIDFSSPINLSHNWFISTTNSIVTDDNTGITLDLSNSPSWDGSKVVVNSKLELNALLDYLLSEHSGTKISYQYNDLGLLEFFTKDINATAINVQFGSDNSNSDHAALQFSDWSVSGNRSLGTLGPWTITGLTINNITDEVYNVYDKKYTRFGNNSLLINKQNNTDRINIYSSSMNILVDEYYYASFYLYDANGNINTDNVKAYLNGSIEEWDEIETSVDNWYILKKKITGESNIQIGLSLEPKLISSLYLDAAQLENNKFMTPFVEDAYGKNDSLIINKSLINPNKGAIFLRFNPKFDFYEPKKDGVDANHLPRILFETLGVDSNDDLNLDYGFRCVYYFDDNKNRGIIEFSINGENGKWELELVPSFWYKWHSISIVYDFDNDRYVYRFDYFNHINESILDNSNYDFTDLYIGSSYPDTTRTYAGISSDIEVKDIIITNYPLSDEELKNWVQSLEFFNISQINNIINEAVNDISIKSNNNDVASSNLISRLDTAEQNISNLQSGQTDQDSDISDIKSFIGFTTNSGDGDHENRIDNLENEVGDNSSGLIKSVNDLNDDIDEIRGSSWTGLPNANLHDLRVDTNDNTSLIAATEANIRSDLASNALNLGASLIGVNDTNSNYIGTNVEEVLAEIAGSGRTTENLKTNADNILANSTSINDNTSSINSMNTELSKLEDDDSGNWNFSLASIGYNVYDIRTDLNLILSSTTDGNSGADNIAATAVGSGTAETVQGILEELNNRIISAGGSSLNDAYHNGSNVTVDASNVEWDLGTSTYFKIYDSIDGSKFVITNGTGSDSIRLDTSGGFIINSKVGSYITVDSAALNLSTSTSGNIAINSAGDVVITAVGDVSILSNIIPLSPINLGSSSNKFSEIWAQEAHFNNSTIYLGDTNIIKVDNSKFQVSNDSGSTFSDIVDKNDLEAGGNFDIKWSDIIETPSTYTPSAHTHVKADITDFDHDHDDIYYTKTEMNNGQMNSLYFTKNELNTGALNSLYYTETELDSGQLNNLYYTETELSAIADSSSGADLIGATAVGSGTATTVQGILEELDTSINSITETQSLNDAYDNGSIINVDSTDVEISLSSNKSFKIYDATDTNKFIVSEGSDNDSIKVATSGGVDIAAYGPISFNSTNDDIVLLDSHLTSAINLSDSSNVSFDDGASISIIGAINTAYNNIPTHNHDDRYYTETELDSGQLDNRYYTETEIDSNFYTKTDIDNNIYTKSELDSGQLDNRYYTETEVDQSFNTFKFPTITSDPTDSPNAGTARFRTDTNTLWIYNGSTWVSITLS